MAENPSIPAGHLDLVKAVTHGLRRRCGVEEGSHILVAVSGGADSVALLRALEALKGRRRWRLTLTVGHVQHHLRDEAEGDAGFVEDLARQLKLPRLRRDLDLSEVSDNLENAARRARYGALSEMARECGASFIATGHHGDDQLETLLMRMLRGAGTKGMSGIAWRRSGFEARGSGIADAQITADDCGSSRNPRPETRDPILIRPMLAVTRAEVHSYLRAIGQTWREDLTNTDTTRWRARLRAQVLPVLDELRPGAGSKATAFADQLRGVHHLLDDAIQDARQLAKPRDHGVTLDRAACRKLRRVVLSGLMRALLTDANVPADTLNTKQVSQLTRAIRDTEGGERTFTFAGGTQVNVSREQIILIHQ